MLRPMIVKVSVLGVHFPLYRIVPGEIGYNRVAHFGNLCRSLYIKVPANSE